MSDRVTQLQDAVNQMAEHFCNSIGVLQQNATPSKFQPPEKQGTADAPAVQDDFTQLFAQLIARTAKDIDVLIESLPSEELTTELQNTSLKKLEQENKEAAQRLSDLVKRGDTLLLRIQEALSEIAEAQLRTKSSITSKSSNSKLPDNGT
ncbi:putative mediator of RNA polymerase II transcription subunit 21 isoform X1 [Apostichopus japonicus]|uniref:Mediator of RNA polymerase II transcription subunit 21 n=1 Tax=Stichopus japonicus TaxID=307972 RepID=A0A2G8LFH8_STIJA|nr:putative mediator of RNA polymerase II transcription subunit 21 isoform X1 [Apostichopus japonicus]